MSDLPAKKHQDHLKQITKNVKISYDYFKRNYDQFHDFMTFVFKSNLSDEEKNALLAMSRPTLEFNILEAYISRLLGEFSKQEPDIEVNADDPATADPQMIQIVEQHLRHVLNDSKNHHTKYRVYKDLLAGGFSVIKVFTEYSSPMSMKQDIKIERVIDPTMCGFDHLAHEVHKGDGRYCFELFPMSKEEFKREYPNIDIAGINFTRAFEGFNWCYEMNGTPTLIVGDYYEKKKKEFKIVQVRDGKVMKLDDYKKMVDTWDRFEAPPAIVGKPRKTTVDVIVRYRLIENLVLEYEETDYNMLPLVFVDGNSVMLKEGREGNVYQFTRPYVYHAKGAQRLKNFAGISLANAIENQVQHKFMVAKEALPKEEDFLYAYKNPQISNTLVYNSVHENNPEMPILNPIQPIPQINAPQEIMQGFQFADSIVQNALGSFDAQLGINDNQLSGIAIVEAASQSNAAAMPYIVGFLQGYQRAAQIYVDLLPKYYVTDRTIPLMDDEGHRYYIQINGEQPQAPTSQQQPMQSMGLGTGMGQSMAPQQGQQPNPGTGMMVQPQQMNMGMQENGLGNNGYSMGQKKPTFDYDENALNVIVKAGASFQVQKNRTLMMVKEMMGMSPLFAQFIAEKGLNFVLENMEGKGIEQLKELVDGWLKEMQMQKQQQMQMQQAEMQQQQQNPAAIRAQVDMQKLQLEQQKMQMQHQVDMLKLEVEHNKIDAELLMSKRKDAMEIHKAHLDHSVKLVDSSIKATDVAHKHSKSEKRE
jgi:hypothetical protein